MLELDALRFIGVVTEVRRLATVLDQDLPGREELLVLTLKERIGATVGELRDHLEMVGAQSAWVAEKRL